MVRYVCGECTEEFRASPFRMSCPECGGQLVPRGRRGNARG